MILSDNAAERAVLAGVCKYGAAAYYDVADLLNETTFVVESNSILYACIKKILQADDSRTVDLPSILSAASEMGLSAFFNNPQELNHLNAILKFPVVLDNVRRFAAKIRKLQIARLMYDQLEETKDKYLHINGDESISHILGIAEESIFNFSSLLNNDDDAPKKVFEGIEEHLIELGENPVDQIGVSSGFTKFDFSIGGGLRKGTISVVGARPKSQPLTAKVLTPNGWTTMGDIKLGDIICSPSNKTGLTKVVGVYPQGKKEAFQFFFTDDTKTVASKDHYWKVKNRRWPINKFKVLSFAEMQKISSNKSLFESDKRHKWQFPLALGSIFNKKNLVIDPYVLGALLGDGCLRGYQQSGAVRFSTKDLEIIEILNARLPYGYKFTKKKGNNYDWRLNSGRRPNDIRKKLIILDLYNTTSHTKFIPEDYLYSSLEDRTLLLAGLLDTDGSVTDHNNTGIEYTTASKKLAEGVKKLVLSLGGISKTKYRHTKCNGKSFPSYRMHIKFNDISNYFLLKRKKELCQKRTKPNLKRGLIKVLPLGPQEMQCIRIEDPDGLYITDDYIVTHNTGKTIFAENVGVDAAIRGVPVLNLDTEMMIEDHKNRGISMLSYGTEGRASIDEVETGRFAKSDFRKQKLIEVGKKHQDIPYYHKNIGGKPFEDQMSIMRRWLAKEVGLNDQGKAKDCLIIYDYLKLMDGGDMKSSGLQEFQLLGFMMTSLHNFALRYEIPMLVFIQLNRDGITKESTDSASGSDRIIWLCSNFSIYKQKSDEEIANDGPMEGNRKLVPIISRHGEGLTSGDYINIKMHGKYAKLIEGQTALEIEEGGEYAVDERQEEDVSF